MAKISRDLATPAGGSALLHPRETLIATGNLGALNAEIVMPADGGGTLSLDLRGTFSLTVEASGTVDGTNYTLIPLRPRTGGIYVAAVAGTVAGLWVGDCSGYRSVRVRVTAYTSGTAAATLAISTAPLNDMLQGLVTPNLGTTVGTAGAATTLTLAAPGAGLRHYLTYLSINRFATALLTAAAAPVAVTTTNLPGSLAFSFAADAAAQGTLDRWREDFAFPIISNAQNTATTIVCPATTGVIWRVTAGFYVAP
jgi:hypothetical protein